MKRISSILLALFMLVSVVGVTVNKHYCGNALADITFYVSGSCACGEMEDEEGCCHEDSECFQFDEDHTFFQYEIDFTQGFNFVVTPAFFVDVLPILRCVIAPDYLIDKPPLIGLDILLFVQCFRI